MGCSSSQVMEFMHQEEIILHTPINTKPIFLGDKYDIEMIKIKGFISSVEEVRHAIVDVKEMISLSTGNCSRKKEALNVKYLFVSMALKFSTDLKGKIEEVVIEVKDGSIIFRGNNKDSNELSINLFKYLARVDKLKERIEELTNQIPDITEIMKKLTNDSNLDRYKVKEIATNIDICVRVIKDLPKERERILREAKEGIRYITDSKNRKFFNEKGLAAYKAKMKIPYMIIWFCLEPNERFKDIKTGYYIFNERVVTKKKIKIGYQLMSKTSK